MAAGSATFNTNGNTLNVTTGSNQTIINWQGFSIGAGETTNILQPNSSSTTFNRVLGGNPSQIYGTLYSNGGILLINPNGILVGAGGMVNTQTFTGSTLNLKDRDFLAGGEQTFKGRSQASVVNLGNVIARQGDIFLISRHVFNGGNLTAANGTVGLAAGTQVTLASSGDDRLSVRYNKGRQEGTGIDNEGTIDAVRADLKANGNLYGLAVNNGGLIRATGVSNVGGRVLLTGFGGKIKNTGTILAKDADGTGGKIETSGDEVSLAGTILTGKGGTWLIDPLVIDNSTSIDVATIVSQLNTGDVVERATNSITLDESLVWSGTGNLSLISDGSISLTSGIIATGTGSLTLQAAGTITLGDFVPLVVPSGTLTISAGNLSVNSLSPPGVSAGGLVANGTTVSSSFYGGTLQSGTGVSIVPNFVPGNFTISGGSISLIAFQSNSGYGKSVFVGNRVVTLATSALQPSLPAFENPTMATSSGGLISSPSSNPVSVASDATKGAYFTLPGTREQVSSFRAGGADVPGFSGTVLGGAHGTMSYQDPNR